MESPHILLFNDVIIMSTKTPSSKSIAHDDETQNVVVDEEIVGEVDEEVAEAVEEEIAEEIVEEVAEEIIEEIVEAVEEEIDEEKLALAEMMFHPIGKNPYYLNGRTLKNLQDLVDNLDAFTGNEGMWVADWIEYLGDDVLAALIRNWPEDFKQIVIARYIMIREYHSCIKCEQSN